MTILPTAHFDPNALLFWFYMATGLFTASMTAIFMAVWYVRRDPMAAQLAMLLLWIATDLLTKAVLRSPQPVVSQETLLFVARVSALGIVTTAAMLVDSYLAAHNGHLSMLRRFVLWYRRDDDDPIWQRWRDG